MIRVLLAETRRWCAARCRRCCRWKPTSRCSVPRPTASTPGAKLQRLKPDIPVTDIEMPGLTGLELAQRAQRHELPVKVVILTTFARPGFLRRALDAGVCGYLLKDSPAEQLADAIRTVRRGGRAVDPQLAMDAWSEADPLNDRERQVLRLAGDGLRRRHRDAAQPVRRHGAELPVRSHRQARRREPDRSEPFGAAEGLVVAFSPLPLRERGGRRPGEGK